jgi:hypothetical protein
MTLVLRVFLRRLVDNDVISPNADRHESLAVMCALVVSFAVFVSFLISWEYLSAFIQLPGPTALSALSDRFLFISASIAVSALAALMVWDGLALEPRDTAILGPLPIPSRTITRAKLAAAVIFGTVFAVLLNAIPSVLYPLFLTMNLRGTHGRGLLQLIAGHATTVVMAGLFGFFSILATRGLVRLMAGERGFRRVSSTLQSVLVVGTVTAVLLAPTVRKTIVREWVGGEIATPWPARPVLWYLGLNETMAGHVVAETPVVLPPRLRFLPFSLVQHNDASRTAYETLLPPFAALAQRAWLSVPVIVFLGIASFVWNNRRLPEPFTSGRGRSRIGTIVHHLLDRLAAGNPSTRAGFFFTWQTLTRSAAHRTVVAMAVAAGLTHLLLALTGRGVHRLAIPSTPLGVLAIDLMTLAPLLAGFRYAVTVPSEWASNWTIRMAWLGDERDYLAGVKRAALVGLVAVPLLLLLPLNVALLGFTVAAAHSIGGFVVAATLLDAVFFSYRQLPFACSYVPIQNPKVIWPAGAVAVLTLTYGLSQVERWALQTAARTMGLGATLVAVMLLVRMADRANRRERLPVDFDARPALPTQRLGLFEHVAQHN